MTLERDIQPERPVVQVGMGVIVRLGVVRIAFDALAQPTVRA